jgi:hypothetical protein
MKVVEEKRYKAEKDIFDRALAEKEVRVQKLEKEIAYLSTLLTYWKPLDELKDYNIPNDTSFHQDLPEKEEKNKNARPQPAESSVFNRSLRMSKQLEASQKDIPEFAIKQSKELFHEAKAVQGRGGRVQQTADERHSEGAEKRRKVGFK